MIHVLADDHLGWIATGFIADIHCDNLASTADASDLHALESHASLYQDYDRISYPDIGRFYRPDTVGDCRQAVWLSEMQSSTRTSAISEKRATSLKQPGWSLNADLLSRLEFCFLKEPGRGAPTTVDEGQVFIERIK